MYFLLICIDLISLFIYNFISVVCKNKGKCTKQNGVCQKKSLPCNGQIIKKACKDNKSCDCCVPTPPPGEFLLLIGKSGNGEISVG